MTLKEMILKKAYFNWIDCVTDMMIERHRENYATAFGDGAQARHDELIPLIEALAEAIQELEKFGCFCVDEVMCDCCEVVAKLKQKLEEM